MFKVAALSMNAKGTILKPFQDFWKQENVSNLSL